MPYSELLFPVDHRGYVTVGKQTNKLPVDSIFLEEALTTLWAIFSRMFVLQTVLEDGNSISRWSTGQFDVQDNKDIISLWEKV